MLRLYQIQLDVFYSACHLSDVSLIPKNLEFPLGHQVIQSMRRAPTPLELQFLLAERLIHSCFCPKVYNPKVFQFHVHLA